MKHGRRWDANCRKSRQRHKARFPDCIVLFEKGWNMREMRRYPWQDKKEYEKRLNRKRVQRHRMKQNPEKQSRVLEKKLEKF